ncbi:UNVERIFIED_CONTAM: hypothetical protein K2H54_002576 [Gekko kuhli]
MYQHLYQKNPLWWGHFNPESTEDMYVLTRGPWRDSLFEPGLCDHFGYSQFGVMDEMAGQRWVMDSTQERSDRRLLEEEDYNVDAWVEALERGQQEMKRDLEEVVLAIPDMYPKDLIEAPSQRAHSRHPSDPTQVLGCSWSIVGHRVEVPQDHSSEDAYRRSRGDRYNSRCYRRSFCGCG